MSEFRKKVGRLVTVGVAAGIGMSACGSRVTAAPSPEVRMQQQIADFGHDTYTASSKRVNNDNIVNVEISTLPNGTRVELEVSYQAASSRKKDLSYFPGSVDGISLIIYGPGSALDTKPDASFSLGEEVNTTWDASYNQFKFQHQPFSVGEQHQTVVETVESPGIITPTDKVNHSEAHAIYEQILTQSQVVLDAISHDRNFQLSPHEVISQPGHSA